MPAQAAMAAHAGLVPHQAGTGDAALLDAMLLPDNLLMYFQPVFELTGEGLRLYGVEALTRGPRSAPLTEAESLFVHVRRCGRESAVDRACILAALCEFAKLAGDVPLALNVHASTLARDADFGAFLLDAAAACAVAPSRLVLEIVEYSSVWQGGALVASLRRLRDVGVRVALDDLGFGRSNYRLVVELQPDLLKIDRYGIQGCHANRQRRALVRSLVRLARDFGGRVVAEGIEDTADLATVAELGVRLVQGYLLAPPCRADERFDELVGSTTLRTPALRTARALAT